MRYAGIRRFNQLTTEEREDEIQKPQRRGRSEGFIKDRNQCLLYRYYFYAKLRKLPYIEVLKAVGSDFFIANRTIINIAEAEADLLKNIFKEKPSIKELEKKYNFLNWKGTQ